MNNSCCTPLVRTIFLQGKVIARCVLVVGLIMVSPAVFAQQGDDPLLGTWKNSYGSELSIPWHDLLEGSFYGTYSSSTGATGKYNIVGYSPPVPSRKNADEPQPLAFSILWQPIEGATGSPDEEWTSSMTGQMVKDKSGAWVMEVFHSLNASTPLSAVEITEVGRYSETLTFKRTSNVPSARMREDIAAIVPPVPMRNPLQGDWVSESSAAYPYLSTNFTVSKKNLTLHPGQFIGSITLKGGKKLTVLGYTAAAAPTGDFQSASFVFVNQDDYGDVCYSANGFLYQGSRLELTINKSRAAPYSSKYTAVQITEKAVFYRGPSQGSVNIALQRNKFTNNGASEWTANFSVGDAIPYCILKFGIDTGGNFTWMNSKQCTTQSCTGFGHVQFDPSKSSTFQWIDKTPKTINWGPWGHAMANLGSDYVSFRPDYTPLRYNAKLITHFDDTPQFDEFLWDGAFAFPASSTQMLQPTSNLLKNLIDNNQVAIKDGKVCVAFYYNPEVGSGFVTIGEWDSALADTSSKLTFEYEPYSVVPYLWCAPLTAFSIGNKQIASGGSYSFDTGSSALKGDSARMQQTLSYAMQIHAQTGAWPPMRFDMGKDSQGQTGVLELTADQYVQLIEEGEHAGENVPQIQTLSGTPNLYLQGSTMMNHVYSVFWWDVHPNPDHTYDINAREVWLFNKKEGPQIIKKRSSETAAAPSVKNRHKEVVLYPNPAKDKINIMLNLREKIDIKVNVYTPSGVLLFTQNYRNRQGISTITIKDVPLRRLSYLHFLVVRVSTTQGTMLNKQLMLSR